MSDKNISNTRKTEAHASNGIKIRKPKLSIYTPPYLWLLAVPLVVVMILIFIFALAPFANRESYVDAPHAPERTTIPSASTLTISPTPTPDPTEVRYLDEKEIADFIKSNEYESEEQRKLVGAAVSLVGKVHYFWGGKSLSVGEDPEWGQLRPVISVGHDTSGTQQPYGLDCSGYVNWCCIQLCRDFGLTPEQMIELIGDGTWNQWNNSEEIDKKDLRIGDLAFINSYPTRDGNHVGICVGFARNGEPLIAHCSYTMNNVVVSTCGSGFMYFRRPKLELV